MYFLYFAGYDPFHKETESTEVSRFIMGDKEVLMDSIVDECNKHPNRPLSDFHLIEGRELSLSVKTVVRKLEAQ